YIICISSSAYIRCCIRIHPCQRKVALYVGSICREGYILVGTCQTRCDGCCCNRCSFYRNTSCSTAATCIVSRYTYLSFNEDSVLHINCFSIVRTDDGSGCSPLEV